MNSSQKVLCLPPLHVCHSVSTCRWIYQWVHLVPSCRCDYSKTSGSLQWVFVQMALCAAGEWNLEVICSDVWLSKWSIYHNVCWTIAGHSRFSTFTDLYGLTLSLLDNLRVLGYMHRIKKTVSNISISNPYKSVNVINRECTAIVLNI